MGPFSFILFEPVKKHFKTNIRKLEFRKLKTNM